MHNVALLLHETNPKTAVSQMYGKSCDRTAPYSILLNATLIPRQELVVEHNVKYFMQTALQIMSIGGTWDLNIFYARNF
jgi:hypothetical protein